MLSRGFHRTRAFARNAIPFVVVMLLGGIASAGTIKTEGGVIQGTVEDGLSVYRGIPYAAPPVGDLRWRAPEPAAKWQGVRMADRFGAPCIQSNKAIENQPIKQSEDCLYLNVWTPAKDASDRLPVMFWIHGGGFTAGATLERLYHGEQLAKKGVVVVTIGYRLGVMGFLAHPGLSAENPRHVSGNYGMLDMIAGLRWVQRNIAAFGGDSKRVTIFGESAGGAAVSILCASPLAKGLFQGAISQSGGFFAPPVRSSAGGPMAVRLLSDAEQAGQAWAATLGASTIADLRKLPAEKVLASATPPGRGETVPPGRGATTPSAGRAATSPPAARAATSPVVDEWVIADDQYRLYESGRYNDTPILVGYNSDEGATIGAPQSPESYLEGVRQRYGPYAEKLIALYPAGEGKVAKTARDLSRDVSFGWATWTWVRLQTKTGKSKAFLYYFDQHPDYPPDSPRFGWGAPHAAECPFVFQHLDLRPNERTPEDQALSETIVTYWTNFAKRGDPNGPGLPNWPAFNDAQPQMMYFAHTAHPGPLVSAEGLKELEAYFAWQRAGGADRK
jgi:para-nitrobenzyl esterase